MAIKKGDLLDHFIVLQEAIDAAGAEAILSLANFSVFIRRDKQDFVLYPQFLVESEGVRHYVRTFSTKAKRFIGWLPYYNKRWDLASDKLLFKEYVSQRGIKVPAHAFSTTADPGDFIIKRRASSFGQQIKGPFRSGVHVTVMSNEGEYAEQFIRGKTLKIWYWDGQPVCMEMDAMAKVTGDGTSSIRALIEQRLTDLKRTKIGRPDHPNAKPYDFSNAEQFLAFEGKTLETVLPYGAEQTVDPRYATPLMLPAFRRTFDLQRNMPENLRGQLLSIGNVTWHGIPETLRANTVYTVDAILESNGDIRVLEMNSNPFLHPLVYRFLIPALFAQPNKPNEKSVH